MGSFWNSLRKLLLDVLDGVKHSLNTMILVDHDDDDDPKPNQAVREKVSGLSFISYFSFFFLFLFSLFLPFA